jgi:hypothetical protein
MGGGTSGATSEPQWHPNDLERGRCGIMEPPSRYLLPTYFICTMFGTACSEKGSEFRD